MLVKRDLFRALKSFHVQSALLFTILLSVLFTILIATGQKIGISIFGELITYKDLSEVLMNGLNYTKGLGFLITFIISIFIAQEYQYNTWQHYLCSGKTRLEIYLGKYLFSLLIALTVFLLYTFSSYITSFILGKPLDINQILFVVSRGMIVYTSLASIVVLISMSLKNYISSILSSFFFVFFEKDILISVISLLKKINLDIVFVENFTLMKINTAAQIENINIFTEMVFPCAFVMILTIILGCYCFSKHEL
ncbi:ABC transporter permease [Peptococcus simiae]|uniref:ABC transporter permease n=1 Tax=Peptococcus simiae TaxID=1643805 RepID=A0ABW9H1G2_9FIRM